MTKTKTTKPALQLEVRRMHDELAKVHDRFEPGVPFVSTRVDRCFSGAYKALQDLEGALAEMGY